MISLSVKYWCHNLFVFNIVKDKVTTNKNIKTINKTHEELKTEIGLYNNLKRKIFLQQGLESMPTLRVILTMIE